MGQIEKTQQDLEMERALRTEVEMGKKVFVKKIIIRGATLITEDQLKQIILPFEKHWLNGNDIKIIIDAIAADYKQNGYEGQPFKVSSDVKNGVLEINIEEVKH